MNSAPVHYSRVPQTTFFNNFFIKNGSHDTIHTFKNYFATVFFSFQFQLCPNEPQVFLLKIFFFCFKYIYIYILEKNNAGIALEMLEANPNFATAKDELQETTLHVLARNPSAFVSGSRPGLLRRHFNIPCELFRLQNS